MWILYTIGRFWSSNILSKNTRHDSFIIKHSGDSLTMVVVVIKYSLTSVISQFALAFSRHRYIFANIPNLFKGIFLMYLYLDESGDLGFDFTNKKPSGFFVITLFVVHEAKAVKIINKVIEKTLDKQLNRKSKNNRSVLELKGGDTTLEIKKYFLRHLNIRTSDWDLYTIVLNKQELLKKIRSPIKDRIYNQMTHELLEKISFPITGYVNLIIDRSKDSLGIKEFNDYLYANLSLCLNLKTKLHIFHHCSTQHKGIQAADMFCHGIARKHELNDRSWYNLFKEKILVECEFKA